MELVRVFCTYLGAPNCHVAKNPKNPKIYRKFVQHFDSAYLLPIFPVWSQPMGAHGNSYWQCWESSGQEALNICPKFLQLLLSLRHFGPYAAAHLAGH